MSNDHAARPDWRASASPRALAILDEMTMNEKLAQLVGYWVDQGDEVVAPMAGELRTSTRYEDATVHGIGHLTRVYGTRPVDPAGRAAWLWGEQRRLRETTRLGIPAIVHEECLTGLAAWQAATFPTPLAWGASFDDSLVEQMGHRIGRSMRALGIHQGLAPVLDVIRDPRWGRVDECIAEDPYVVGVLGSAYVRGLQDAGVHATLKHFVAYSASTAGRNHAPVHAGPREIADVFLPPFEMAVREAGARSVMNSYTDIDGVPVAADPTYLTDLLRGAWGFDGVVVSDYFSVAFLETMQQVAADRGAAAMLALRAGIDVELPSADAYPLLADLVSQGALEADTVDRAVARVLMQKEQLGLLDETFADPPSSIDLDSPDDRALSRALAEESLVLLSNDGILPLRASRIAVIGPNADSTEAMMGCYSFVNHVLAHHPGVPLGISLPTVLESVLEAFPQADVVHAAGCSVEGADRSGFAEAVSAAAGADVAVVVVGDRAGLFGRGTVGEGNDVDSLELPGEQRALVEAVTATGTPVVLVLLTGRPYAIGWALPARASVLTVAAGLGTVNGGAAAPVGPTTAVSLRPAAVLQAFFPGEEGGPAIAAVLRGDVSPSGRLPVSLPGSAGAQPYSYLHPTLGGLTDITSADPTPALPFGFGLSYTTFRHDELVADPTVTAGDAFTVSVRVRNTGDRNGVDVVQLYGRDQVATIARPVAQLLAFERVALEAGEAAVVRFSVPTQRLAFTGLHGRRIVEPGAIGLWVGGSCADKETQGTIEITGSEYRVSLDDPRTASAEILRLAR